MTNTFKPLFLSACFAALCTTPVLAQTAQVPQVRASAAMSLPTFAPKPQVSAGTTLSYEMFDDILEKTVIETGPSLRKREKPPIRKVGTKIAMEHTSPYRLEGNRVPFAELDDDYKEYMRIFADAMVDTANNTDITRLSRDEQLAFWINLHNAKTLSVLADNYPIRRPESLKLKGSVLDNAKLMKIRGKRLSLRDIREGIVYANWQDTPDVIYGFWRGDIASPSLRARAYTSANVRGELAKNGEEFTNSLRGFQTGGKSLLLSPLYATAKPHFFGNNDAVMLEHIRTHMREEVKPETRQPLPIQYLSRETVITDLTAGYGIREAVSVSFTVTKGSQAERMGSNSDSMRREFQQKEERLREKGLTGWKLSTVKILDVPTSGN